MLVMGEGAEEKVDGHALAAWGGRFHQLERAIDEGHVAVGRDDVGAVGQNSHAILYLKHLHPGVAAYQLSENTLVIRRQMLHQHKRHPRITRGRHPGKKCLKSPQPACRRTYPHNGKTRHGFCHGWKRLWHAAGRMGCGC